MARSRRSASPLAARACEPYWPSSSATAASVASDSWSRASATSTRLRASWRVGLEPGDLEAEPLGGRGRRGQALGGLVDGGLDLDQAGLAGGAPGGEVGAEQVAVAGHRDDVGQVGDQAAGGGEVVDDGDPLQQPRQRGAYVGGRGHHVDGVRRTVGQRGPVAVGGRVPRRAGARRGRGRRALRWVIASTAACEPVTTTASAALPRAAATAVS